MEWSAFLKYLLVMAGVTYLIRMLPLAGDPQQSQESLCTILPILCALCCAGSHDLSRSVFRHGSLTASAIGAAVALVLGWMGKSLLTVGCRPPAWRR